MCCILGLIRYAPLDAFAVAHLSEPFLQQQLRADFFKALAEQFLSIAPISSTR